VLNLSKYVEPYTRIETRETPDGYIVWRLGTGENIELLHLKSFKDGGGFRLVRLMLNELLKTPPYSSVFGFTRIVNTEAHRFYEKCGFTLSMVDGIYADGRAVVFSAKFEKLCEKQLDGSEQCEKSETPTVA
jgi:hypothetical protein